MNLVDVFMRCDTFEMTKVKYPAATVLLDLTANEQCIEKVAKLILQKEMLPVVVSELKQFINLKVPKQAANRVFLTRYRDLMIGIILNLTCNVESEEITKYMVVEMDIMQLLIQILVDPRHDWPTNGAALALL